MARSKKYVTVRSDHYLAMLTPLGAGIMYAILDFKIFVGLSLAAASYIAFTIVRDWEDLWVVSSQDDVELRQYEVRGILEPPQPEES